MKTSPVLLALFLASASAFTTPVYNTHQRPASLRLFESSPEVESKTEETPFFVDAAAAAAEPEAAATEAAPLKVTPPAAGKAPAPKKKAAGNHKEGVFTPAVLFMKELMGDKELNKLRAKVISKHTEVIGKFVETSDSAFGDAVLRALFRIADKDGNGSIDKDELKAAVQSLGFTWLEDKQIASLFARADADGNGTIEMEEWIESAPKTLRTNLTKLAKKNGNELGFLS